MEKPDFLIKNGSDYYSSLEIVCFANMLKNPSSCYKFFCLEAIVNLVNQNISKTTIGVLYLKPVIYEYITLSTFTSSSKLKRSLQLSTLLIFIFSSFGFCRLKTKRPVYAGVSRVLRLFEFETHGYIP